jgi:hypothetical protein
MYGHDHMKPFTDGAYSAASFRQHYQHSRDRINSTKTTSIASSHEAIYTRTYGTASLQRHYQSVLYATRSTRHPSRFAIHRRIVQVRHNKMWAHYVIASRTTFYLISFHKSRSLSDIYPYLNLHHIHHHIITLSSISPPPRSPM